MGFTLGPDDFEHHQVRLENISMHYVEEGSGEPLVLLHGWPTFWWVWHYNIPTLGRNYRVIAPDMRGFGDSENPDLSNPSLYALNHSVNDLRQLLDHLDIQKAHFIAHDYGSMVLHKFLRRHPERVGSILMFSAVMPGFEKDFFSPRFLRPAIHVLINQMPEAPEIIGASRKGIRLYIGHMYRQFTGTNNPFDIPEERELFVDAYSEPGNLEAGFHWYKNLDDAWDPIDRTISPVRARFLWGLKDPVLGPQSNLISDWYTNFSYKPIPKAGHFLQIEMPEILNEEAINFFP